METDVPGNTKPFIPSQLVEIELAFSGTDLNDFGAKLPLPNSSADASTVSFALLSSLNGGDKKITFVPLYRSQVKSRPVGWISVYDILMLLQDCNIHLYESELDDALKVVNENCDVEVKEISIYQPDHVQRITAEEEIFAADGNIEEVLAIDRRDEISKDPSESTAELIKFNVIDLLCEEILSQVCHGCQGS
ncbi:hypothetical protein BKA69DRAFT_596596 [Paraphysoderma sedebokerense]|nr:hypothetical protein BKA69DRAFT_596596 [Paraphysoderma sedebokerense]